MPGALSPLISRSSSGTSSFGAPSSGSVKAEFDNSVDTATSSDVNTIEDQAVLAAAALGKLFLDSCQKILDPQRRPKISPMFVVGLLDAQARLNGALSVLNDGINLAQGSSDTSSSHGVSVSAAIGAVYTAWDQLNNAGQLQGCGNLTSEQDQANFNLIQSYCKSTPGTTPTNPS